MRLSRWPTIPSNIPLKIMQSFFPPKARKHPQLYSRHFKVDPNTFYQGLQSVSAISFGASTVPAGGSGSSGGGSSGGSGGSGGSGSSNQSGAVVPVVNVAAPGSSVRSSGSGGGGQGGGGHGGRTGDGGLNFVHKTNSTVNVSVAARNFFTTLGVDLIRREKHFFQ